MKAFFTKIIKTISAWSAGQKAIAAIVAVAGVSVLTASGILIYKSVNTEPVAQIEDTEAAVVVAVPDVEPETETEIDDYKDFDYIIKNTGIDELRKEASSIIKNEEM